MSESACARTYLAEADLGACGALRRAGVGGLRGREGPTPELQEALRRRRVVSLPRGPAGGRGPAGRAGPAGGPAAAPGRGGGGRPLRAPAGRGGAAGAGTGRGDTTNGSSYPVSEWALGLMLVALRNAGAHFRRLIAGEMVSPGPGRAGYLYGELTGKRVGLIGCGHIGRPPAAVPAPLPGGRAGLRPLPGPRGARRLRLQVPHPGAALPGVRGGGLPGPPGAPHTGYDRGPGSWTGCPREGPSSTSRGDRSSNLPP